MTILGGIPLLGSFFSSSSKPDRIRRSIKPLSSAIKLQQQFAFSTTASRFHPQSGKGPEVITESSVLNNFPRPNLTPTLHFSLFGLNNSPTDRDVLEAKRCLNCNGPHSTDFCPC